MSLNDDELLDQEIAKHEQQDIVEAQKCLEQLLKTTRLNTTTFNKLLFGLIDTYASKPDNYEHKEERINKSYQRVMTFCADRLTQLNKPRATGQLLKEVTTNYSSRNEFVKEANSRRINDYVSVGEHQFSDYKPEYEQGYTESLKRTEDALKYFSGDMLTQKQKKLTSSVNIIVKELLNTELKNVLSRADIDTVKSSVKIIDNIKHTVTHAKEVKKRTEARREQERKQREYDCKKAVKTIEFNSYPLTDLVNLAIHYTKIPSRFQSHQEYMLDANYLIQEIRQLDTKKIERFKSSLIRALTGGLICTVEELSYNSDYINGNVEYKEKLAPKKAIIQFIDDWKNTNYEKINTQFEKDFTLVKSISLITDIVKSGVKP